MKNRNRFFAFALVVMICMTGFAKTDETEKKGQSLFPRATQFRSEDLTYDDGNTIYYKTYYDDFVRGKIMDIDYHIDIDIRDELEDYFLSDEADEYEIFESLTEMFYDYRTVEIPEEDLIELFYRHGYILSLHSAEAEVIGKMHIRFVEITEKDGLSLYPSRILLQSWYGYYLYLQNITGPIPRKIKSFLVINNSGGLRLVVHSSGLSRDYVAEEELSFWKDRGGYWILSPMELEIDTSHAHITGEDVSDLNKDALFEPTYYKDGIAYKPSRQSDGANGYTFRLGKMEEVEENKIFRLEAVTEVEGRLSEFENCYIQFEISDEKNGMTEKQYIEKKEGQDDKQLNGYADASEWLPERTISEKYMTFLLEHEAENDWRYAADADDGSVKIAFGVVIKSADGMYPLGREIYEEYMDRTKNGIPLTEEEALELTKKNLAFCITAVNKKMKAMEWTVTQNRFDALVDLVWNMGVTALDSNAGRLIGSCDLTDHADAARLEKDILKMSVCRKTDGTKVWDKELVERHLDFMRIVKESPEAYTKNELNPVWWNKNAYTFLLRKGIDVEITQKYRI